MQLKNFLFKILLSAIIILPVFLNLIPVLHAFYNVPKGMFFTGNNSWFDPWDVNVYVSMIKYGQQSGIIAENYYTTIPHHPIIFYPLYTLTGFIFKNVNPYLLFHFLASFFGLGTMMVLWLIAKDILKTKIQALISICLISMGGGFGWLVINKLNSPDITMTGFTLMSAFQRAHESLGIIIFTASLVLFSKYKNNRIIILTVTLLQLMQIFIYPYLIVSFFIIIFWFNFFVSGLKNMISNTKPLIVIACLVFPVLFIYTTALYQNPGFNLIYGVKLDHPSIIGMISGYGFLLPLFFIQLLSPAKNKYWYLLNIWILVSVLLSYLPFGFARFYLKGIYIPAVFMVFLNLKYLVKTIKLSTFTLVSVLIIFVPLNSVLVTLSRLQSNNKENLWVYKKNNIQMAVEFLNKIPTESGVLSLYRIGNLIPARTNNKVFFGHMLQTPNSPAKIKQATEFYAETLSENEAVDFLNKFNIGYVYFGEEEKSQFTETREKFEEKYPFLRKVYDADDIQIYAKK